MTLAASTALADDEYSFISEKASNDAPRKTGWFEHYHIIMCRFLDWNVGKIGYLNKRAECRARGVSEPQERPFEYFSRHTKNNHEYTAISENCREVGDDKHKPEW